MIFIKPKLVHVDCFTYSERTNDTTPIKKASHYTPDWWKALPKQIERENRVVNMNYPASTMKTCYGLVELYKYGFIVPMWTDLLMSFTKDTYKYICADGRTEVHQHNSDQHAGSLNLYWVMKLLNPWIIYEKTGIQFLLNACHWSLLDYSKFKIPYGVLEFKHQHNIHVNFLVEKHNTNVEFDWGVPLLHIIPLVKTDIKIKTHVIDRTEYDRMSKEKEGVRNAFRNFLPKLIKLSIKNEQ